MDDEMSIQQFRLRWNNHQPNFISVFTTLLNTESLVDVTLAAEGRHLQAHKVVLSACSVYFQTLFAENPSRHPIVILNDVKYEDLRIMVDFMYCGEVNVSQEQLPQILETAKMLKIKGLTEMPESTSLTKSQTISTVDAPHSESPWESQRHSISPCNQSPSSVKRRRFRKLSTSNPVLADQRNINDRCYDGSRIPFDHVKGDAITLSTLPHFKKESYEDFGKEPDENGAIDASLQQITDTQTNNQMSIEQPMYANQTGLVQGGQWPMIDHNTYPRYNTNACIGDSTITAFAMNNVMNHQSVDMNDYNQAVGMVGPSPDLNLLTDPQMPQGTSPQNALPKKRRKPNPQSEENFQKALEAVRFGGIGFCKAARMFGVNNRTLWLEYKKKGYTNNRPSIKSRIKREPTPPAGDNKEESPQSVEQQMPMLCMPQPMPMVGFIDSRQELFPAMQSIAHNSPINLHGINFSTMQ